MRVVSLVTGICAALSLFVLLGAVQLIWAGSEASYYLHLLLGLLLTGGLVVVAASRSPVQALGMISIVAALLTLMPFDALLQTVETVLRRSPPQPGDLLLPNSAASDLVVDIAAGWIVRTVLLGLVVLSTRVYHKRRSTSVTPRD